MDYNSDLSQYGQENPRVPFSPELNQLFDAVFDYPALLNDTEDAWEQPSHRASPQDLNKLITEINPLIDTLESHRFFRMTTSFGSDDDTGTSPGYSGHPSPPELVQEGGSTSPSDHSGPTIPEQPDEPYQRSDISIGDIRTHDDKWTYPQAVSSNGPREHYAPPVRVLNHGATSPIGQAPTLQTSGRHTGKRQRQLENPDQTADVRKSGACLPCRVSKTRCHENGVCPTCRKAFPDHSHMVCARKSLSELWPIITQGPDVFSKDPRQEAFYCGSEAQRSFIGRPRPIQVFFSPDARSPAFNVFVQAYRWATEDSGSQVEKLGLSREHNVNDRGLLSWVDKQIRYERGSEFPKVVQRFLLEYARDGHGLPKHDLVESVHKMSCYFRILKAPTLWCQDPSGKVSSLPSSVQAQLRSIARLLIGGIERNVFKALDNLTTPSYQPKSEERLALWACLWQLILMYRELTAAYGIWSSCSEQNQIDLQPNQYQRWYRFMCESVFPLVSIFYHYQFRTKKNVEVSMDWMKGSKFSARRSKAVEHAAQAMLDSRKHFLKSLQASENDVDRLLCVFVVNHELKKLNARKRTTKTTRSAGSARVNDECDDDAE